MKRFVVVLAVLLAAACGPGSPGGPKMNSKIGGEETPPISRSPAVSGDIMMREPVANSAQVKHILLSWKELGEAFGGRQDKRAQVRTKADAEAEVKRIMDELAAGGDFDVLMKENSEDLGSASSGIPFKVTPDAQLVIEFRQLSLRLNVGEIGVCESDFGFHIIKRVE